MNLYEIIQDLCNINNITISALEKKIGIGNGTIRKWKNAVPSGDRLSKVADYFNVSVDFLLNRQRVKEIDDLINQGYFYKHKDMGFILFLSTMYNQVSTGPDNSLILITDNDFNVISRDTLQRMRKVAEDLTKSLINNMKENEEG